MQSFIKRQLTEWAALPVECEQALYKTLTLFSQHGFAPHILFVRFIWFSRIILMANCLCTCQKCWRGCFWFLFSLRRIDNVSCTLCSDKVAPKIVNYEIFKLTAVVCVCVHVWDFSMWCGWEEYWEEGCQCVLASLAILRLLLKYSCSLWTVDMSCTAAWEVCKLPLQWKCVTGFIYTSPFLKLTHFSTACTLFQGNDIYSTCF